jgi:hypothetical protein
MMTAELQNPMNLSTYFGKAGSMDWFEWHKLYERKPALQRRLELVCKQLSDCLNLCPSGEIRVISVCAGDGRDLIGALKGHPRERDVEARLVEMDTRLVECGREMAASAGLSARLEFLNGDATSSSAYEGIAPANLVLLCGMLGHVDEASTLMLVEYLPALCRSGGFLIWTRNLNYREGVRHVDLFKSLLRKSGFEEMRFEATSRKQFFMKTSQGRFIVSTYRYHGESTALPVNQKLFEIMEPS